MLAILLERLKDWNWRHTVLRYRYRYGQSIFRRLQYSFWAALFGCCWSNRLNRIDLLWGAILGKSCWCGKTYWRMWWHQEC